jgi:hypothetical protein
MEDRIEHFVGESLENVLHDYANINQMWAINLGKHF